MFKTGLVSVTFRPLSPEKIIALAAKAGLQGIEWGGDVHVPAGDLKRASEVKQLTHLAGLCVFSYGSYYRIGCSKDPKSDSLAVLRSAHALGAPIVRIWGYDKGSTEIDAALRKSLVNETRMLCERALEYGIALSLECHPGTLTDAYPFELQFLEEVNRPNLKTYWQPNPFKTEAYNKASAKALAAFTNHIHAFHWDEKNKYPLHQGEKIWRDYLDIFKKQGGEHALLLEFMHDDSPDSLPETAKTLSEWIL